MVHPRALMPVKLGGQVVESSIVFAVLAYMLVYGVTMIVDHDAADGHRAGFRHRLLGERRRR